MRPLSLALGCLSSSHNPQERVSSSALFTVMRIRDTERLRRLPKATQ